MRTGATGSASGLRSRGLPIAAHPPTFFLEIGPRLPLRSQLELCVPRCIKARCLIATHLPIFDILKFLSCREGEAPAEPVRNDFASVHGSAFRVTIHGSAGASPSRFDLGPISSEDFGALSGVSDGCGGRCPQRLRMAADIFGVCPKNRGDTSNSQVMHKCFSKNPHFPGFSSKTLSHRFSLSPKKN